MLNFLFEKTPLHYLVQSFWRDEAFSYLLAKKNIFQILVLSAQDFSPPFYPLLLKLWMAIFGSSEIALRSLSLVAYLFTFYFFYMFLIKVIKTNRLWTIIYSILFFANPFLNYYAFEARGYSLFSFFTIASFYYFYSKKWTPYIVMTVLGLFTHYFMVFVVISQALIVLLSDISKQEKKEALKIFGKTILYFAPWVLFLLFQNRAAGDQFWIEKPTLQTLFRLPSIVYFGYEKELHFFATKIGWFSSFLYVFLIGGSLWVWITKKNRELLKMFLIWVFLPTLVVYFISLVKPVFLPRYLILTATGSILLFILLFEKMHLYVKTFFLVFILFFTLNYSNLQVKNRQKQPVREVSQEIKAQADKNDLIYVTDILDFHTAEYYLGEDKVFIYNKDYAEIPAYVGRVLIPKNKIASTLPFYPRKAFVINDNLSYNIQAIF